MNRDEIEQIAERAAAEAVKTTLLTIGIDIGQPLAAQRDFMVLRELAVLALDAEFRKDIEHTRRWRKAVEAAQTKGMMTIIGAVVTGAIGLIVVGLQQFFGRH